MPDPADNVDNPAAAAAAVLITRHGDHAVRQVAGGNHVTTLLHAQDTAASLDAVEVYARPGGGPPPHRHLFGEWFLVGEGTLTITGIRDGQLQTIATAHAGDSVWVPPNTWHGTINNSRNPTRFLVIGVPAVMTNYFDQAGIVVPDETTPAETTPPGPDQLAALAEEHDIEFYRP